VTTWFFKQTQKHLQRSARHIQWKETTYHFVLFQTIPSSDRYSPELTHGTRQVLPRVRKAGVVREACRFRAASDLARECLQVDLVWLDLADRDQLHDWPRPADAHASTLWRSAGKERSNECRRTTGRSGRRRCDLVLNISNAFRPNTRFHFEAHYPFPLSRR